MKIKVLNLYAGIGGNRKLWDDCEVTAVEYDADIAAIYQTLYPNDVVFVEDAHAFLLKHHAEFDFIWASPPCQTHSRMQKGTRHKTRRYPDMRLYQEIIFLTHFFKGVWIVENVIPYYAPLINPTKRMGRYLLWCNFGFESFEICSPKDFIKGNGIKAVRKLMLWLGMSIDEKSNWGVTRPIHIFRNCIHPRMGNHIFQAAKKVWGYRKNKKQFTLRDFHKVGLLYED